MTSNERVFTPEQAATWQPGDPLYQERSFAYLYNWRIDPTTPEPNADAATWPDPPVHHRLDNRSCGVEAFITRERRARTNDEGEAA